MLHMTREEVRLRAGSQLIWRRYELTSELILTITEEPVRLLAALGSTLDSGRLNRFRVMTQSGALEQVDGIYLHDPTRRRGETWTSPYRWRQKKVASTALGRIEATSKNDQW